MSIVKKVQEELRIEKENSALFKFQKFIRSKKFREYKKKVLGVKDAEDEAERLNNEESYYLKLFRKNPKKYKNKFLEDKMIHDKDIADYLANIPTEDRKNSKEEEGNTEGNFFKGAKVREFTEYFFKKVVAEKPILKKKKQKKKKAQNESMKRGMTLGMGGMVKGGDRFRRASLMHNMMLQSKKLQEKANGVRVQEDSFEDESSDESETELTYSEFVFDYMKKLK